MNYFDQLITCPLCNAKLLNSQYIGDYKRCETSVFIEYYRRSEHHFAAFKDIIIIRTKIGFFSYNNITNTVKATYHNDTIPFMEIKTNDLNEFLNLPNKINNMMAFL